MIPSTPCSTQRLASSWVRIPLIRSFIPEKAQELASTRPGCLVHQQILASRTKVVQPAAGPSAVEPRRARADLLERPQANAVRSQQVAGSIPRRLHERGVGDLAHVGSNSPALR